MKNDIKTRIDRFIKKYPEPYQFQIVLSWQRKDGLHSKTYFEGNDSGHSRSRYGNYTQCFYTNTGRDFIAQHYRYDEKLGLLELAYAVFDCHVPKQGENRRWKYGYRYFIPKDTRDLYNVDGEQRNYYYSRATYDGRAGTSVAFAQQFTAIPHAADMWHNEFLKFAGNNVQTTSPYYTHITNNDYPWLLSFWFEYVPKTRTTGKVQKRIDELVTKELELSDDARITLASKMNVDRYKQKYAWFDLDNKVFRCFVASVDDIFEDKRVYLDDKGKVVAATITPENEWVTNRSFTSNQFNFEIVNIQDVFKLTYFGYLKNLASQNATVYRIVSAIKHPEVEQFTNMGLLNIANKLYRTDHFNVTVKDMFGEPNKKKNVLAKYNINKKQAEYIDARFGNPDEIHYYRFESNNVIASIKEFFNLDNVASLDYDTFVKYCKFVGDLDWSSRRTLRDIPADVRQKVTNKLCNMYDKHDNVLTLFSDTVRTYNGITRDNRPNTDVYAIKSYEELVRLHDTCIELKRLQDEERRRLYNMAEAERHAVLEKKMAKLDEERRKFNYSDADFTIRLPEKLSEIVNEGSSLRHCVGGYTQNHAEGHTTIMFLRRNDDPTTSFYTIEIRNDNSIQQIHGFGNKWLGNNPEAIPTVMRWLAANNLRCSDEILLSTAKGYCSGSAPLVEKPII